VKVVFLSTYPPAPCGIGDYTRALRHAVERGAPGPATSTTVEVVAERHPAVQAEVDPQVERVWQRRGPWDVAAAAAVIARRPAVLHVQHEEAILGQDGRLIRFLEAVGKAGIARVVTLHSVYGGRLGVPYIWSPPPTFHRAIAAHAEAIVVHQHEGGQDFLERQGVPAHKIQVIAHGTPHVDGGPRDAARARLALPANAPLALFLGVIHRKKNLHTLLVAAAGVAAAVPGFRLVIAGRLRDRNLLDARYGRLLARLMRPGIAAGWLDFRGGYLPAGDIPAYLAAADVVLLPHDQRYGSASGVFHLALGAGRALVCSSSPKFGEARELLGHQIPEAIVPARDAGAWQRSITTLLRDPALRQRAEALSRSGAHATAWPALGARYRALYHEISGGQPAAEEPAVPLVARLGAPAA
jgi:glycosyltransferase involved in cell wall biosynthesis